MLSYTLLVFFFVAVYFIGLSMGDHYERAVRGWFAPRGLTTADLERIDRLDTPPQNTSLDARPLAVTLAA